MFGLIPLIWIFSEVVGSLLFATATFGPGGTILPVLSFGYVGYLAANHALLIQFAQIGGVYSLGLLVSTVSVLAVWVHIKKPSFKKYVYVIGCVLFITSFTSIEQPADNATDSYSIAIVDTDFSLEELKDPKGRVLLASKLEEAVQQALLLETDYILLPEDSRYFNYQNDAQLERSQFSFRTDRQSVIIVDSGSVNDEEKSVVESFVYNGKEQVVDQSHKRYLVPQGEYMPTLYLHVLHLFGRNETVDDLTSVIAFEVGSNTSQAGFAKTSPGVLFCFESVSPWSVRQIINERGSVPFIAHPVSHAWFHESSVLQKQLENMVRIQAIWNQEYIVSAGNRVRGYAITQNGNIIRPKEVVEQTDWSVSVVFVPK
jgi:apolipoprotein N-acyltransferase